MTRDNNTQRKNGTVDPVEHLIHAVRRKHPNARLRLVGTDDEPMWVIVDCRPGYGKTLSGEPCKKSDEAWAMAVKLMGVA